MTGVNIDIIEKSPNMVLVERTLAFPSGYAWDEGLDNSSRKKHVLFVLFRRGMPGNPKRLGMWAMTIPNGRNSFS
jgi:hypothetical protein